MSKRLLSISMLTLFLAPALCGLAAYRVQELGGFEGGSWSTAVSINQNGQAAGTANLPDSTYHAALFSGGTVQDLGTLPGGGTVSIASAINSSGEVVGTAYLANNWGYHGFLYSGGVMIDLGSFPWNPPPDNGSGESIAPSGNSGAAAINDLGQVVGASDILGGGYHACIFANGELIDLGTLGGLTSAASGINNKGEITGAADTSSGTRHVFLFRAGRMEDLGTLPGGTAAGASAINDNTQIVGRSSVAGGAIHAFCWTSGVMKDLGTLPGIPATEALALNGVGQVVGAAKSGRSYRTSVRGFLYSNGVLQDLNDLITPGSGWVITEARGINGAGQIVALGRLNGGATRGVLLTP